MSLTPREFTIMGLIAIMVAVILAVTTGLYIKAGNSHDDILQVVQDSAVRLEALEQNKASATAKRFTSDDGEALMKCLRIPNLTPAREACLQAIEANITERSKR